MSIVKNYKELNLNPRRKIVLDLVEAAISAIQPGNVINQVISLSGNTLRISDKSINLDNFEHVFLLGFGKGSGGNCKLIERILSERLTGGYVVDVTEHKFAKIDFTLGTHPLPSQSNIDFTRKVIDKFSKLGERDLVIIVICGGGSVMLAAPHTLSLERMVEVNRALLHSGADISEMNAVRKHLDVVKGGGLAEIVYPATVYNLIFSDVPGNDLSVIASGPTVFDKTNVEDALSVIGKYHLKDLKLTESDFGESPKDGKYFEKVNNVLALSNTTALEAMRETAEELGQKVQILTDDFVGDANDAGKKLIEKTEAGSTLLCGGETSLVVTGDGEGGRNQQLVLAALPYLGDGTIVASFDSDGWDNSSFAGAIADMDTVTRSRDLNLDPAFFLNRNDSYDFFKQVGGGIETGRLPSNVSDLMIVSKV